MIRSDGTASGSGPVNEILMASMFSAVALFRGVPSKLTSNESMHHDGAMIS